MKRNENFFESVASPTRISYSLRCLKQDVEYKFYCIFNKYEIDYYYIYYQQLHITFTLEKQLNKWIMDRITDHTGWTQGR